MTQLRAVEMYYTIAELALLLRVCSRTISRRIVAGEFGSGVVNLGSEAAPDWRVPASGVNAFLEGRRLFAESPGVVARSVGELRRKVRG